VAQAAYETYSVLTAAVWAWLDREFSDRWIGFDAQALRTALGRLEQLGVSGGATYDGLIAITAAESSATLLTLDRRALDVYRKVGVDVELVA